VDDKEKRFVDELLDASLRRYASAEPRPGLEGRVVAGVRAQNQAMRRRSMWAWAMGMAAAAAMATLLVMERSRHQPVPLPATAKVPANVSAPAVAKITPPVQPPLSHRWPRPASQLRVDPRPQQFPTPRPLSEQEKLLLVYAHSIEESPGASAPTTDQDFERDLEIPPIRIAAIKIEPLDPSESEGEK
jgi:hypothetical protein